MLKYKKMKYIYLIVLICFVNPGLCQSAITLPQIFGNGMVLQRDLPIPVWGNANPGEEIMVLFNQSTTKVVANENGQWKVELPPMKAGGPYELIIKGKKEKVLFDDILIGEVWLASGQSNMRWFLEKAEGGKRDILTSENSNIRLYNMDKDLELKPDSIRFSDEQLERLEKGDFFVKEGWKSCSPETVGKFSAIAYYFGKELHDSLNVPIGLIHNAQGGSQAEYWIDENKLGTHPQLSYIVDKKYGATWMERVGRNESSIRRISLNLSKWLDEGRVDLLVNHPLAPGYLFKTGIKPLAPYAIRGIIWYQGESNSWNPGAYSHLFRLLINSWRELWGQGDIPFYYLQLPGISSRRRLPEFREMQKEVLSLPNTGMAVIIEAGDPKTVHPVNKKIPAHRLALLALAKTYDYSVEYSGPVFQNFSLKKNVIRMKFNHADNLQGRRGENIKGFTVQGYVNGSKEVIRNIENIIVDKNEIILKFPEDVAVTKVKYGWAPYPECNLVNGVGLPASPFKIEIIGIE